MDGNLEHQDEQGSQLISGVLSDARDLAIAEVDKLKAEALTTIKGVGADIKLACAGFLILTVAAVLLGAAIALGLAALGLPSWLAFGLVGLTIAAIGGMFLKRFVLDKAKSAGDAA